MFEMGNGSEVQLGAGRARRRPAADCHLYLVDAEGVLFCEGQQEIHALNTTAAFVWLALEDGGDEESIAQELSEFFGVSPQETRTAVGDVLRDWRQRGLLAGYERNRPPLVRPVDDVSPVPDVPAPSSFHNQRTYRMLDTSLTVYYGSVEHEEWVHPIMAHLMNDGPARHRAEMRLADVDGGVLLFRDGAAAYFAPRLSALGPAVKGHFLGLSLNNHPYLFQIHAGVAERDGSLLILPAIAGSGKSSLTSGLLRAGWRYLSDETAPLAPDTLRVRPVPLAMATKTGAWPLLQPYYPELATLRTHIREDDKHVRYLVPPASCLAPDREDGYPIRWIVFPSYHPDAKTELKPLSKVETLRRLLAECMSLPRHLDEPTAKRIAEWIHGIEGYELPNSNLEAAMGLIENLRGR
jgi:hypothetical protein